MSGTVGCDATCIGTDSDIEIPMLWKSLWLPSSAAMYEGAIQI